MTFVTISDDSLLIESVKKWKITNQEEWDRFIDAVEAGDECFERFTFSSSLNHAEEETGNEFVQKLANHLVQ